MLKGFSRAGFDTGSGFPGSLPAETHSIRAPRRSALYHLAQCRKSSVSFHAAARTESDNAGAYSAVTRPSLSTKNVGFNRPGLMAAKGVVRTEYVWEFASHLPSSSARPARVGPITVSRTAVMNAAHGYSWLGGLLNEVRRTAAPARLRFRGQQMIQQSKDIQYLKWGQSFMAASCAGGRLGIRSVGIGSEPRPCALRALLLRSKCQYRSVGTYFRVGLSLAIE